MNISRDEYLKKKLAVEGECECEAKGLDPGWCGYCWYNSVTCWNPPECRSCLDDFYRCKEAVDKARKGVNIKLKLKCCRWCCWYDWFDAKRISYAKNKSITVDYID